jgi:hypothetical protein
MKDHTDNAGDLELARSVRTLLSTLSHLNPSTRSALAVVLREALSDLNAVSPANSPGNVERLNADSSHVLRVSPVPTIVGPKVVDYDPHPVQATIPLETLADRLMLKVEAIAYATARRRRKAEGMDIRTLDAEGKPLFSRAAELQRCYLWMMDPHGPALPDDASLDRIARVCENASLACRIVHEIDLHHADDRELMAEGFQLLAEAQSALRSAATAVDDDFEEPDQFNIFQWLRRQTKDRRILVRHYMTRDASADPSTHVELHQRLDRFRSRLATGRPPADAHESAAKRVAYHAKRVRDAIDSDDEWSRLFDAVAHAVASGLPPTDLRLRQLLAPLVDDLPDRPIPEGAGRVFDAIDQHLESALRTPDASVPREPSETLLRVRRLLSGRVAVLVGGQPREPARRRVQAALGLEELRWIPVAHHQSIDAELLPQFRRGDTDLFITLTRWRSHALGPQMREWCKTYDKLFVELPQGYNEEQIAHQIAGQLPALTARTQSPA